MTIIQALLKAKIGRIMIVIQGQPRQSMRFPSQSINWAWWYVPVIPAILEVIGRTIMVCDWPQAKMQEESLLQNNNSNKGLGHGSSGIAPAYQGRGP
jgi:hypothetical protein